MWQSILSVVLGGAALLGGLGVISKAPPVRWLIRRNVADPISEWHEASTLKVLNEHVPGIVEDTLDRRALTNGWGTEAVHRIAEQVGADVPPPPVKPAKAATGGTKE